MARLRDLSSTLRSIGPWGLVKRVWNKIGHDNLFVWASALAYSWLLAIFPLLIFLLTLAPYLPLERRRSTQRIITEAIDSALGPSAAPTLADSVESVMKQPHNGLLSLGLVLALWAASGGLATAMAALDQFYEIRKPRRFYHHKALALGLTIVLILLVMVVLVLLPMGAILRRWLYVHDYLIAAYRAAFDILRYVLGIFLMFAVLAIIYTFGPSVRPQLRVFSPGAIFCVAVWILLHVCFRIYIDNFNLYGQTYGAMAGAAILLFFFYLAAVVLLIGAEINSVIDSHMGRGKLERE